MSATNPQIIKALDKLKAIMSSFDAIVGDISRVEGFGDGSHEIFYQIVLRACLIRQREAIDAIVSLCESGNAAFSACLLRPAYEELLWLAYLKKHPVDAPALITRLALVSIGKSIEVQRDYVGDEVMESLGFSQKFLRGYKVMKEMNVGWIRAAWERLGWGKNKDLPSVAGLADKVGRRKEYNFLYQATSRFVHFSPHELCRRAWGNAEGMTISSKSFAAYWGSFSIYWSTYIYIMTLTEVWESLNIPDRNEDGGKHASDDLIALLEDFPPVPIVTREELEWFDTGKLPAVPGTAKPDLFG